MKSGCFGKQFFEALEYQKPRLCCIGNRQNIFGASLHVLWRSSCRCRCIRLRLWLPQAAHVIPLQRQPPTFARNTRRERADFALTCLPSHLGTSQIDIATRSQDTYAGWLSEKVG